jgi:hypothetical protein
MRTLNKKRDIPQRGTGRSGVFDATVRNAAEGLAAAFLGFI